MAIKNAFYAQSGGVTAVINASAAGVLETARQHSDKIGNVYAGRNGIIGALTEDLIDTNADSTAAYPIRCFWILPLQIKEFGTKSTRIRAADRSIQSA